MARTDRLFELILILRDGRLHRAADLAARCGVSERTILRDMGVLKAEGVPVAGARGLGFLLREPVALPALALTPEEVAALQLGADMVRRAGDPALAEAAERLAAKVEAAAPARATLPLRALGMNVHAPTAEVPHLGLLRKAVARQRRVALDYRALSGAASTRVVRPLSLEWWGVVWTLTAWCEVRAAFRVFRVDRIEAVALGVRFPEEPGRRLADYLVS